MTLSVFKRATPLKMLVLTLIGLDTQWPVSLLFLQGRSGTFALARFPPWNPRRWTGPRLSRILLMSAFESLDSHQVIRAVLRINVRLFPRFWRRGLRSRRLELKRQRYLGPSRHVSKHFLCDIWKRSRAVNACVSLLKQTQRLSITAHSNQSQSSPFKSRFACCAFILHHGLFRSIFTTTVIATNQEGKVNGMGLTSTLTKPSLGPASAKFTAKNFTCRWCSLQQGGEMERAFLGVSWIGWFCKLIATLTT